jgi:hypothetical protein
VFELVGRPGYASHAQIAVLGWSAVPAGPPALLPGLGLFQLDASTLEVRDWRAIAAPGGRAEVRYPVPQQPALLGGRLAAQALLVHFEVPAVATLTNALVLEVRI